MNKRIASATMQVALAMPWGFLVVAAMWGASCSGTPERQTRRDSSSEGMRDDGAEIPEAVAFAGVNAILPEAEAWLRRLSEGDADSAAMALVALASDTRTTMRHYSKLIDAVSASDDELNLEFLREACTGFHRRSARVSDPRRNAAILNWVAWRIWQMPVDGERQRQADRFVGDVDRLIDAGRIDAVAGMGAAAAAVMQSPIEPLLSEKALLELAKKHVLSQDKSIRESAGALLLELGERMRTDRDIKDLYDFYSAHSESMRSKRFPPNAPNYREYIQPTMAGPRAILMSRSDYETLPSLSVEALGERIRQAGCCTRNNSMLCRIGVWCLLDKYEENPEGVKRVVGDLVAQGNALEELGAWVPGLEPHPVQMPDDVVLIVVEGLKHNVRNAKDYWPEKTVGYARSYLRKHTAPDAPGDPAFHLEVQKRAIEVLLHSYVGWAERERVTRVGKWNGDNPLHSIQAYLGSDAPSLTPEAREHLRTRAVMIADDVRGMTELSAAVRTEIEDALTSLAAGL